MAERKRRKSNNARQANQTIRSRTMVMMALLGVITFVALFWRLYDLQINQHEELESQAVKQQTLATTVTASRGTIYDRTGNPVAISATAETVIVAPAEILEYAETQAAKKLGEDASEEAIAAAATSQYEQAYAYMARGLSRILGVDEAVIQEKMQKTSSKYEEIKKKVDQTTADEVRRFLTGEIDDAGNEVPEGQRKTIRGVHLKADSKRYYPYGTLAAGVIGFINADNVGAYGLEAYYNDVLEGSSGLTITAKNAKGTALLYQYEQYYDAQNGHDLVLTIDTNAQYYLEKGLASMVERFDAKNGATGIVMDVNTGGLLAMASCPTYDLNDYSAIYDTRLQSTLDGLDPESEAYSKALSAAQYKQWRNKCVNDTYEPGSTFKPITLATALEEGLVNLNTSFSCSGSILVPGWRKPINCSKRAGHGVQTLEVATGNSCNPAFITMGLKIGTEKYYEYLKKFGLMESTGIDLYGEAQSIFASEKNFNSNVVSLASYAFGQTFNVTPLQLIRAQAACINGGYLRTPYLVEQVLNDDGSVVSQHDSTPVRQVISEETSAIVRQCLEYVVAQGTGKNGQVVGYRIGGKTGTADKTGNPDKEVVVSFMCFAPADDPQVMMLITMDTPSRNTGVYVSGGNMVAPTASAVMSEILPALGIEPDYTAEQLIGADAVVSNCIGLTAEEAKSKLAALGFTSHMVGSGDTVTDQTPVGGSIIPNNAGVILYLGEEKPDTLCVVPNVVGKTAAEANAALTNAGLIMKISGATAASSGNVYALNQSVAADSEVEAGTVVTVQLGGQNNSAD